MVEAREDLSDGSGVGDHAHGTLHLGQVATRHHSGGLVVDATLEACGAPVHKLDGPLRLDGGDRGVHILGDNVTAVHEAACHVLAVAGVALGHHGGGLEGRVGDLCHRELLVVRLLSRDDGRIGGKHEVDSGVGHQVGLELSDVNVESAIEAEGGGQGGDDLSNEAVKVGVGGTLDVQGAPTDVVHSLVVEHDSDICVLQQGVGGEHGVVGLHHGCGNLGGGVHCEPKLGLLAVVDREALKQQGAKARASAAPNSIEHQEALEPSAVVCQLANAVKSKVDDLLADGVVTASEVVGSILLAGDELLGMEQLAVGTSPHLVHHSGLEIEEDGPGHVLAGTSLAEEGVESIITSSNRLVGGHLHNKAQAVTGASTTSNLRDTKNV